MAEVRYIVNDVPASIAFYTGALGFELIEQFGPAMAIVRRGDLDLWLAGPLASASRPMPDGSRPVPGGFARIVLRVDDLDRQIAQLKGTGVRFRNDIVAGPGGRQVLCLDPAGNLVELFERK
ncbi:MAG TPA: VOC family protein [Hyphomicrobiaceae bacterium]|nr:VOC family protein [Hyphomicrobiaceae bacterium]